MKLLTSAVVSPLLISLARVSCSPVKTIDYADGDVYVGEVRNGEPNGQRALTFGPGNFEGDVLELTPKAPSGELNF